MENSTLFASTVIAVAVGVLVGALPFILLRVRSGSAANNESRDIERLVSGSALLNAAKMLREPANRAWLSVWQAPERGQKHWWNRPTRFAIN